MEASSVIDKIKIVDSRFPRIHEDENDKMEIVDSRFHRNDRMEGLQIIDTIKIADSRFHENDKIGVLQQFQNKILD